MTSKQTHNSTRTQLLFLNKFKEGNNKHDTMGHLEFSCIDIKNKHTDHQENKHS